MIVYNPGMNDTHSTIIRHMSDELHALPWDADPDTYRSRGGLSLQAELAEQCRTILGRAQTDLYGDCWDQDTDAMWYAVMSGDVETAGEADAFARNLLDLCDARED